MADLPLFRLQEIARQNGLSNFQNLNKSQLLAYLEDNNMIPGVRAVSARSPVRSGSYRSPVRTGSYRSPARLYERPVSVPPRFERPISLPARPMSPRSNDLPRSEGWGRRVEIYRTPREEEYSEVGWVEPPNSPPRIVSSRHFDIPLSPRPSERLSSYRPGERPMSPRIASLRSSDRPVSPPRSSRSFATDRIMPEVPQSARSRLIQQYRKDYTVLRLRELAKENGITGYSSLNKAQLIQALIDAGVFAYKDKLM